MFGFFGLQVSYHPQPGRSINANQTAEFGRGVKPVLWTTIRRPTLAMKRELDDSDAASAVTLPQSRPRPDDASGHNKMPKYFKETEPS